MGSSFSKQGRAMRDSASSSPEGACKKEACAIQACLSKKNYNPDACTQEIEKLKRCCEGVQAEADGNGYLDAAVADQLKAPCVLPSVLSHHILLRAVRQKAIGS